MSTIYISQHVKAVRAAFAPIIANYFSYKTVGALLNDWENQMWHELQLGALGVFVEISNHHPAYLGKKQSDISIDKITHKDTRLTTARSFGYKDWDEAILYFNKPLNLFFERAVNATINGDIDLLKKQLSNNPELIHSTSDFGHHAGLLHYTASNGVEIWRQVVPENLSEVIAVLCSFGVDKNGKMSVYNGQFTAHELFVTSAHPKNYALHHLSTLLSS